MYKDKCYSCVKYNQCTVTPETPTCKDKIDIVPNNVYKFNVYLILDCIDDIIVYTEPDTFNNDEDLVKKAYFTQERIDELKEKFINYIKETKNPFIISCNDTDCGYRVSDDMIFRC